MLSKFLTMPCPMFQSLSVCVSLCLRLSVSVFLIHTGYPDDRSSGGQGDRLIRPEASRQVPWQHSTHLLAWVRHRNKVHQFTNSVRCLTTCMEPLLSAQDVHVVPEGTASTGNHSRCSHYDVLIHS